MQNPFRKPAVPTAQEVAAEQLAQAQIDLLAAQKDSEHYLAQVSMLQMRIARLSQQVEKAAK